MSLSLANKPDQTAIPSRMAAKRQAALPPLLALCALVLAAWGHSARAADASTAAPTTTAAPAPAASPTSAPAAAATTAAIAAKPPVQNSAMDGALFYQVLIAEVQSNAGDAGSAYQIYLEAAKRQQNGQLYQRAVEIALRGRAGEQALTAAKAWRQALPNSREASEYTAQILLALGRSADLAAPLRTLIQLTPAPQQPQVIATLPRTVNRLNDKKAAAQVIDDVTQGWRQPPLELAEAWAASAEGWLLAKDTDKAMAAVRKSFAVKPSYPGAGLVAIDLMLLTPQAEDLVKQQLALPDAPTLVRLAYARRLAASQRMAEAADQLEILVSTNPEQMGTWLTLAAVRLELKQLDKAEAALQPLLRQNPAAAKPSSPETATKIGNETVDIDQAYLLMSQIAEQRNQLSNAGAWLEKADPKREKLNIQAQRARLLYRQGKLDEARKVIRELPETEPRDAVTKFQAEAQLLRDAHKWDEAYKVMAEATKRFPDDSDLLYDQAMLGEKLHKYAEMESQLRKVIEMAPDNPNAFNALGYSLADRGTRLDEARTLIAKALELRPGDPFISDSMGWLEFRAGRVADATRILREAYQSRPDPEIGAHLGEVLWTQGQQDEARRIWAESVKLDAENDTLAETLKRLKIKL
ncbi:MAG: tetratricopeptide repeat protein [Aquabacterium sp.]